MSEQALQRIEPQGAMQQHNEAYGIAEVLNQKKVINELLKKVMIEGTHVGAIPGCGDKKALLKPGAETIGFTFRLAPEYAVERRDLPNGHMEAQITCTLRNIVTGQVWGQGIGSCSSMENKYRFQTKNTGRAVPEEFWKTRDKELLGGPQYSYKKVGGSFTIFETIETENPADKFNTVLKIGKKRAHIDAILTATAASDLFVQDLEIDEDQDAGTIPTEAEAPQNAPHEARESKPRQNTTQSAKTPPTASQASNPGYDVGEWREIVVHWGNLKGSKLVDVPKNKLWFFATKWEPRRGPDGKIQNADDARMKAACEIGFKEMEQAEKEQAGERGEDNVPM